MFCPGCGLDEPKTIQFCRACGTSLSAVRAALDNPSGTVNSSTATQTQSGAFSAQQEIARAIAYRVTQIQKPHELTAFCEDGLPAVEKFLEPPALKRLRRMRDGTITASVGLGAAIFFVIFGAVLPGFIPAIGLGLSTVLFLVGLGLLINGKWFSQPGAGQTAGREMPSEVADLLRLPQKYDTDELQASQLASPVNFAPASGAQPRPASVTEHTTHRLAHPAETNS